MRLLLYLALSVAPLWALACPPVADRDAELTALITRAQNASTESEGRSVSNQMWEIWLDAPDEAAQEMLDLGLERREIYDYAGALEAFQRLVAYCPDYAEGHNQRAFIMYLQGNYAEALVDLDVALAIRPNHVAAQAGRALTLMQLGELARARVQMLAALENNPWLSERALVAPGAILGPSGEDI